MSYAERIRSKLETGLQPLSLAIRDDSERHRGHAGHDPRGETHFTVAVVSAAFAGQTRIARQRLVYGLLAEEMQERVHALSLVTQTPEEAAAS